MANQSDEFLSPEDERAAHRRTHRARSGGYVDHAENHSHWKRRHQVQPESNHLSVPSFDHRESSHGHRRVRSNDEIRRRRGVNTDPARRYMEPPISGYNVREVRPLMMEHNLREEARRYVERSRQEVEHAVQPSTAQHQHRSSRPKIKVEVHNPASRTDQTTPRRSPNRSPRTPRNARNGGSHDLSPRSAKLNAPQQPILLFYFTSLQRKLESVVSICESHKHIAASDPRDLTFAKIAEEVEGCAFQLRVWSRTVNLNNMAKTDKSKRENMQLAAKTLERLEDRADSLKEACKVAEPRDLKWRPLPDEEDEEGRYDGSAEKKKRVDIDDSGLGDVMDSLGFRIHCLLDGLRSQTSSLVRLTRSLQEATPDAQDEVEAVEDLVKDLAKLFPTKEVLALDDRESSYG